MSFPVPNAEAQRLATLAEYDVFNTDQEPALNRIVALAARMFDVPHCFVTLVDADTQLLKACVSDVGTRTMDRSIAFCAHTILSGDALVVEDATADPRFCQNPLVTGPLAVRFYAGAPLRMPGGVNLGSLCLIDTRPRRFSAGDVAALEAFAAAAAESMQAKLTNRRLAEEAAERSAADSRSEITHRLLRTIIEGTEDAVFIKDRSGRYLLINPAGARFLGRPPEEIIGRSDEDFFSPATAESTRRTDAMVLASGQSHTYEDNGTVGGVERTFLSTKNPHRDETGQIVGVIGIARDITERRRADEALQRAKEEAEKANRAKSEFLSRMSHELRTPLNAILGFGQLLEMVGLPPRDHESVGHILQGGRHLLGLIDEVLEISRIEVGKLRLSLEPVRIAEVVRECESLTKRLTASRGVLLRLEGVDGEFVWADRQRIKQVLLNLLSNAIKYNRENGRVTLSCRRRIDVSDSMEAGEERSTLRIEVADTGHGLRPSEIERLFVPFERLSAENGSMEGTGLGLALSKGLVEAMGGRIGVHSVPGEGSCFWFDVPLAQGATEDAQEQEAVGLEPTAPPVRGSVLYIEDNLSNLRLIECIMDRLPGIKLHSATQGSIGLEMALGCRPNLILLDLHLPDIPGWEILRRLKSDARTKDIPVAVISADATAGQAARLREGGAFEYLTKPFDMGRLLRMLDEVFSRNEAALA